MTKIEISFLKLKQEIPGLFGGSDKKPFECEHAMARAVQLLRHDACCPICGEIRTVHSQSDLRILL